MTIDIINYTEEQYAALTSEKLQEIREAQQKKNQLQKTLEERLVKEKNALIDRGVYASKIWAKVEAALTAEYNAEVEVLRDSLLFYLHYAGHEGALGSSPPYPVDYSLSEEDRTYVVRDYYLNAYSDAQVRFTAFESDEFARTYLGEMYASLWHYFQALV